MVIPGDPIGQVGFGVGHEYGLTLRSERLNNDGSGRNAPDASIPKGVTPNCAWGTINGWELRRPPNGFAAVSIPDDSTGQAGFGAGQEFGVMFNSERPNNDGVGQSPHLLDTLWVGLTTGG